MYFSTIYIYLQRSVLYISALIDTCDIMPMKQQNAVIWIWVHSENTQHKNYIKLHAISKNIVLHNSCTKKKKTKKKTKNIWAQLFKANDVVS